MKRLLTLFCLLNALVARADSVILVIGDGMGFEAMKRAQDGGGPWSAFPYFTAIETTNPFCGVPDSASTATAIATGIFTENGMLAVTPDGAVLRTVAEEARDRGLRVGMFTNDEITGATPAAFYAHQPSRRAMPEIAVDLLRSGFSLFMGGGRAWFETDKTRAAGYAWRTDIAAPLSLPTVVLLWNHEMPGLMRDPATGRLLPLVQAAVEALEKGPGDYFIMVENGLIDAAGHNNDAAGIEAETRNLGETVGWLLERVQRKPGMALLVTADHETGGFDCLTGAFQTKGHTTRPVALLSTRPLPVSLSDQTDLHRFLKELLFAPK